MTGCATEACQQNRHFTPWQKGFPSQRLLRLRVNYRHNSTFTTHPSDSCPEPPRLSIMLPMTCARHITEAGRQWKTAERSSWSPRFWTLYTHYNKSPTLLSSRDSFISLVKNPKSFIQVCVRFRTLHLLFCTLPEILCFVFSGWQKAVFTQRNIFFPERPGIKWKTGTRICAAPLTLPTDVYLASGVGGQEGKVRGRWKSLNWSHQANACVKEKKAYLLQDRDGGSHGNCSSWHFANTTGLSP